MSYVKSHQKFHPSISYINSKSCGWELATSEKGIHFLVKLFHGFMTKPTMKELIKQWHMYVNCSPGTLLPTTDVYWNVR